jgi:hypothetical protein
VDRVTLAICAVLVLAGAFYVWIAATSQRLTLTGGGTDPYNQLANAFLHLRLSVAHAPARLASLPEPYSPAENAPFQGSLHDYVLYRGNLFLIWGPAPVLVLLVPLHLLGLEPAAGVTVSLFAIVGLGFALATLRVLLRRIADVPLWMCVLGALTLALASAVPFILRRPAVYEEEISGGYCFAMAGVWLAVSALAERRPSLMRLAFTSLCIGLAAGARPDLALIAIVLVPVYISARRARPRRGLAIALTVPLAACVLLLLAYNQARFGSPLENGTRYQLAGIDQQTAPFDSLSYVAPGFWLYGLSPPRATILFPFVSLAPPPLSYPGSLPELYAQHVEATGGLLPMAPIVVFLGALPWLWRRRPASLERFSPALLMLAGAGMGCALALSYVFFSTTERYEVDFVTLLLIGALAGWFALSHETAGWRRRLVRVGGGWLAAWSCIAGVAITFSGYDGLFGDRHRGTLQALQDVASPVTSALAVLVGHPVLGEVSTPQLQWLRVGEPANITIVSPRARIVALMAVAVPGAQTGGALARAGEGAEMLVRGPGRARSIHRIGAGGETVRIPLHLSGGLNRLALVPLARPAGAGGSAIPVWRQRLFIDDVRLAGGG